MNNLAVHQLRNPIRRPPPNIRKSLRGADLRPADTYLKVPRSYVRGAATEPRSTKTIGTRIG